MNDLWWFAEQMGVLASRCESLRDYKALCHISTLFAQAAGYMEDYATRPENAHGVADFYTTGVRWTDVKVVPHG